MLDSIKTILHANDLSPLSDQAADVACSLARAYTARLVVLHVAQPSDIGPGVMMLVPPDLEHYRLEVEDKLRRAVACPGISIDPRIEFGDAATLIEQVAEETKSDLIVIGTQGLTGLDRLLMGSVAEQILRNASCPVVVVKASSGRTADSKRGQGEETADEDGNPISQALRVPHG